MEELLSDEIAGDPRTEQRWVRSSVRRLRDHLRVKGHKLGHSTVHRLLKKLGFSLRANKKRRSGARAGKFQGGQIPYGYRAEMEKTTRKGRTVYRAARLVKGPEDEFDVLRSLFREYAETPAGYMAIAQRLDNANVPPPQDGKGWCPSTIKRIRDNPVYLGRLVFGRRHLGKFLAAIDAQATPVPFRERPV